MLRHCDRRVTIHIYTIGYIRCNLLVRNSLEVRCLTPDHICPAQPIRQAMVILVQPPHHRADPKDAASLKVLVLPLCASIVSRDSFTYKSVQSVILCILP